MAAARDQYHAYVQTEREGEVLQAVLDTGSHRNAAAALGVTNGTVDSVMAKLRDRAELDRDAEIVAENVRLAKQKQGAQDRNRISNKSFREYARIENAVEGYTERLCDLLGQYGLSAPRTRSNQALSAAVGVLQLTDVHFNEVVDLAQNQYDFLIAGKRLKRLVDEADLVWSARGVSKVVVALTGDLMNSDRRLDELLANQDNRARATLGAVDILRQLFDDLLARGYAVTGADINGNEGRVPKDVGWINKVASDNYDETICRMLEYTLRETPGVDWVQRDDATECVVNIAGHNWLLIHGHQIGKNVEAEVGKLVSKYAKRGIVIRYVVFGHIHSGYLNENFTRSPSPVGDNAYSDKALNLTGRAGGCFFTAMPDGAIHASLVDLQDVTGVDGYVPIEAYRASNPRSEAKARGQGVVIHQVVI